MMKLSKLLLYFTAVLAILIVLFPIYILFLIAFTPVKYTIDSVYPILYPGGFTLANLVTAVESFGLEGPTIRSIETATLVGLIAIGIGLPAAYGLNRLPRNTSGILTAMLFLANMLPAIVVAIPISAEFISFHLYGSVVGLALAQELVVLPLTIFILQGALSSIPRDLEYQARIDGAGLLKTIYTVLAPLAKAGIVAAFLLSWMISWDEFTFAVILNPANPTLPIVIYINLFRGNILASSAFALILTIPVIILTAALQKYLKGEYLTAGMGG
ncbi:MAG: carbohydrate ABC transporter permease [Conexivisphaerales archaeon]